MAEDFFAFVQGLQTTLPLLPISVAFGAVFTVLTLWFACNPARPWWRKRELVTDLCYWFFIPLFARFMRIGLLVAGAALLFGIYGEKALVEFYEHGHGPLARLPLWMQGVIFLVASDVLLYWIHRGFHGERLWKYHAVHHSSEDLEWISAWRFHPINIFLGSVAVDVALLLAGISPNVFVVIGPFTTARSNTCLPVPFFTAGTTLRLSAAARRILPPLSPCSTSCSGRSICPARSFRIAMALPTVISRPASASNCSIHSNADHLQFLHQFAVKLGFACVR